MTVQNLCPMWRRKANILMIRDEKPLPAGFGAVFPSWPPRLRHAGTYKQKVDATPLARPPHRYKTGILSSHVQGPASERVLQGWGVLFSIQGMHPDKEQVSGSVPALRCRVFVLRSNNDGSFHFEELETRADTLTLFPEQERGVLTFRAVTHALDEECEDIAVLSVIIEPQSVPTLKRRNTTGKVWKRPSSL